MLPVDHTEYTTRSTHKSAEDVYMIYDLYIFMISARDLDTNKIHFFCFAGGDFNSKASHSNLLVSRMVNIFWLISSSNYSLCSGVDFFYIAKYLRYTDWVMWEFWRPLPILVFGNIKKKFYFIFLFQTQKKYFLCVVYLLVYTLPDLHGSTGSFVFGVPKVWQGSCRLPSDG